MENKYCVVFDCDGTLTTKESRALMFCVDRDALSVAANEESQKLRARYLPAALAGKLTRRQEIAWLRDTLRIYVKDGLTLNRVRPVIDKIPMRAGTVECLRLLRDADIPVAVISYGVGDFIELFLKRHGVRDCVDRIYSAVMDVDPDSGLFVDFCEGTFVLPSNKGAWSRFFAERHRVPTGNILAVGDSLGDRRLGKRKSLRLGLARDEAEAKIFAQHMGHVVVTDDFHPVTAWLKKHLNLT